jgi:tartrate dehydratase beta subunit/fumarate hydratase class I family protein
LESKQGETVQAEAPTVKIKRKSSSNQIQKRFTSSFFLQQGLQALAVFESFREKKAVFEGAEQ